MNKFKLKSRRRKHLVQPLLPFNEFQKLGAKEFGGFLVKGNPRQARPMATKRSAHLVMRSTFAKGKYSFLETGNAKKIKKVLYSIAAAKGIKIHRFANSGNHLHLIIQARNRIGYSAFIRAITGLIARIVLKAERGDAAGVKFWDARPYTRIIEWGREFKTVARYVNLNILEAVGFEGLLFQNDFAGGLAPPVSS